VRERQIKSLRGIIHEQTVNLSWEGLGKKVNIFRGLLISWDEN
jgi:hypothetical protein